MEELSDQSRLRLLNLGAKSNVWESLAEKRQCVVCETDFTGRELKIQPTRRGLFKLGCPRCASPPNLWVRLGNPLLDSAIWEDWNSAIDYALEKSDSIRTLSY